MKINIAPPTLDSACQAAALALQQDAETTRQNATTRRQLAQQREIDQLERGAAKLHAMADMALASGILQGVTGAAGAGCQIHGALTPAGVKQRIFAAAPRAFDALQKADPFRVASQKLQAEHADCQTEAKAASCDAQQADDIAQQVRRRSQKADDLRRQLMRIEHETRKAAL